MGRPRFQRLLWWGREHEPNPIAFMQRGHRGWADEDTWALDEYISRILAGGLLHLANTTCVHPCRGMPPEDCKNCDCEKLWDTELRENAEKFRLIAEDEWTTFEELQKLEDITKEAMAWLSQWYSALWN